MNHIENPKYKGGRSRPPSFVYSKLWLVRLCLVVFCLSVAISGAELSLAQGKKGVASNVSVFTGTGTILDENIALARDEAISQAFAKAIEEYLIERLGSEGMANNFQRLDEEILSQAKEVIQDYQIISEFRTGKYVKVLMKVRVNEAVLDEKLREMGF